jgi:exosortase/archaeosortase
LLIILHELSLLIDDQDDLQDGYEFYLFVELKERFYSFHHYIRNEMKFFLLRIFCLFMAFQVLFASTGFAVYEHFCKIKGVKTYRLSTSKKLCCSVDKGINSKQKQSVLKTTKCCSDQITYHKISPNASQGHKIDFQNLSLAYVPSSVCAFTYTQVSEIISENYLIYSNSSPPLSGRDRIIFLQSFLI